MYKSLIHVSTFQTQQNAGHLSHEPSLMALNGLETKISRTFLDFLHLGHEFFVIAGHGAEKLA